MRRECPGWLLVVYTVAGAAYFAYHVYPLFISARFPSAMSVVGSFIGASLVVVLIIETAAWLGRQCYRGEP